jgi:prepilin-type N-terminal cleavage/methylation domain-containing protein
VDRPCTTRGRSQDGLTLIELLVAIFIAGVLSALLVMTWISLSNSYSMTSRASQSGELARDAVSRLAREIRDAEPYEGNPAVQRFDAQEGKYIDFTTTFNQVNNAQPLPVPVLTRYIYEINEVTGGQSLHRVRYSATGTVTRNDVVIRDLKNYVKQEGSWVPAGADTVPFRFMYLNPVTREPIEATEGTPPKYISLVRIHLLVQMLGRQPRPTDLVTTVQLRNQNPY